jgi:hypothetical protein
MRAITDRFTPTTMLPFAPPTTGSLDAVDFFLASSSSEAGQSVPSRPSHGFTHTTHNYSQSLTRIGSIQTDITTVCVSAYQLYKTGPSINVRLQRAPLYVVSFIWFRTMANTPHTRVANHGSVHSILQQPQIVHSLTCNSLLSRVGHSSLH